MKKFIYLVLGVVFLYACNQEGANVVVPDSRESFLAAIASTDPSASASEADPVKLAKLANKGARAARYTEYGPFTVNATLSAHKPSGRDTEKILLNNQPLYPTGIYFCEVFASIALVTLPANAIPIFVGASKVGYTENDYQNQSNTNVTRSEYESGGNKMYRMATYTIYPKFNSAGQGVSRYYLPRELANNTYTYKYLLP